MTMHHPSVLSLVFTAISATYSCSNASDHSLSGTRNHTYGIPGILEVTSTFGSTGGGAGENDANFLRTNRLVLIPDDGNPTLSETEIQTLKKDFTPEKTNLLLDAFGPGSMNLKKAFDHVEGLPLSVLALAGIVHGNPPVIYLEALEEYQVPLASKIGNNYYVFGVNSAKAASSYYDCIRYAFMFASALDGKLEYGFDVALEAGKAKVSSYANTYPVFWQRNSIAIKLLAALNQAAIPYKMSKTSFLAKPGNIPKSSLKVGDIMVYTPPGTHPLDKSEDYFKSAKFHAVLQLAFNSAGFYIQQNSLQGSLKQIDHTKAAHIIDSFEEELVSKKISLFRWLNSSMLSGQEYVELKKQAANVLLHEWNKALESNKILERQSQYFQELAGTFDRNTKTFGSINAKDKEGNAVKAKLVHAIPSFHVAMITKIEKDKVYVFQIDGANSSVGSTFEEISSVIVPGSFVNFLSLEN